MTMIVEFPDRQVLAKEAAEWLIRLDADQPPTEEELRALGEWLQRSPAHREELSGLADLWGRMNVLTELAVPLGKDERAAPRLSPERLSPLRRRWRRPGWSTLALAVPLVLAVVMVGLLARSLTTDPLLATNGLYATVIGQQKTTTLADGSKVILNTNSRIRVAYGNGYRAIHLLRGEALFQVAKNADRPFRVFAGAGRIEALGTVFSVYLNDDGVDVTVSEGRVSLASLTPRRRDVEPATGIGAPNRVVSLGPGQEAGSIESLGMVTAGEIAMLRRSVADAGAGGGVLASIKPIPPEEMDERLAWREGILMFSGDTLEDVVRDVSRYTTMSIEFSDAAVRKIRVGGRFPVGRTEVMLAALEANFDIRVSRPDHDRVVLSAAEN